MLASLGSVSYPGLQTAAFSLCLHMREKMPSLSSSSYKGTSFVGWGLHLTTSFNLNHFPKGLMSSKVMWKVGASTYELCQGTIRSTELSFFSFFFFFFFDVENFQSLYWICYNIVSGFYVLVFWSQGMWDPTSLTMNQMHTPSMRRQSPNHWTAREVPALSFMMSLPWTPSHHLFS